MPPILHTRCSEREPPSGPWRPTTSGIIHVRAHGRSRSIGRCRPQAGTVPGGDRAPGGSGPRSVLGATVKRCTKLRRDCGGCSRLMARVCFLDGPVGVNALDHRTRHATQNWIDAGRSRGEPRPLAKLADIGTLLRRATHQPDAADQQGSRNEGRTFHQRRDLSRSWLGCPASSPGESIPSFDAHSLAANRGRDAGTARVFWPHPAMRERFIALLNRAQTRLRRARVAYPPSLS